LELWLKGSSDIGDYECFGILRCAQDDSKNKQRQQQEQTTATARTNGRQRQYKQQQVQTTVVDVNNVD